MKQAPFAVLSTIVAALSIWASFGAIGCGPAVLLPYAWPSFSDATSPANCAIISVVLVGLCIVLTVYDWVLDCDRPMENPWPHAVNTYLVGFVLALSLSTAWPQLLGRKNWPTALTSLLPFWTAVIGVPLSFAWAGRAAKLGNTNRGRAAPLRLSILLLFWLIVGLSFHTQWSPHISHQPYPLTAGCVQMLAFLLFGGWLVPIRSVWRFVVPMPLAVMAVADSLTILRLG